MGRLSARRRTRGVVGLLAYVVAAVALFGVTAAVEPEIASAQSSSAPATFGPAESTAFLKTYCLACHGATSPKGDFNIEPLLSGDAFQEKFLVWRGVLERLEARDMPPDDQKTKRPSEDDFAAAAHWLRRELARFAPPVSHVSRRLNRLEYDNTIRDLLLIDFPAAEEFPPDLGLEGFDNVAEAQSLAPNLLEKYAQAAQDALERAIVTGGRPGPLDARYFPLSSDQWNKVVPIKASPVGLDKVLEKYPRQPKGDVRVLGTGGKVRDGKGAHGYETVIEPRGYPWQDKPHVDVNFESPNLGLRYKARFKAYAELAKDKEDHEVPPSAPAIVTLDVNLRHQARVEIEVGAEPKDYEFDFVANMCRMSLRFNFANDSRDVRTIPRLIVCEIELIGPVIDCWPPASHQAIFGPGGSASSASGPIAPWSTDDVLAHFIERSFRRPARPEEVAMYRAMVDDEIAIGTPKQEAIVLALQAILVSPNFLFLVEESRPDRRLSDYELATRLSYFLWSSMPDAELFRLAGEGKLNDPAVLKTQVTRMLNDPKAEALVDNFAVQWLGIRRVNDLTPDAKTFGNWDNDLRRAIQEEPEQFFRHVMRENLSVLTFLDSDFTFVNERLAKHYGISGVKGLEFRKVDLKPEDQRGGILTQAVVLAVGAQPTRTSPVNRGKFVVDKLFNRPPPNPPADVPKLEESAITSAPQSLRQQLAQHSRQAQCAGCHQKIDYWGLALEGYDGIGGRRKVASEDETADLPDGRKVVGAAGLKEELLRRKSDFVRGLAEKLLLYSLGRTLSYEDKEQIPALQHQVAAGDYRFHALVEAIVLSDPFRRR
jgi:mono/diheme cytochrome c family protein